LFSRPIKNDLKIPSGIGENTLYAKLDNLDWQGKNKNIFC